MDSVRMVSTDSFSRLDWSVATDMWLLFAGGSCKLSTLPPAVPLGTSVVSVVYPFRDGTVRDARRRGGRRAARGSRGAGTGRARGGRARRPAGGRPAGPAAAHRPGQQRAG